MTTAEFVLAIIAGAALGALLAGVYGYFLLAYVDRAMDRMRRESDAEMEAMWEELDAEWFDEEAGVWRAPDYARRAPG